MNISDQNRCFIYEGEKSMANKCDNTCDSMLFILVFLFCCFQFYLLEFKIYSNYAVPVLCLCHRMRNAYYKQMLISLH